jgi:hypothetical protein
MQNGFIPKIKFNPFAESKLPVLNIQTFKKSRAPIRSADFEKENNLHFIPSNRRVHEWMNEKCAATFEFQKRLFWSKQLAARLCAPTVGSRVTRLGEFSPLWVFFFSLD